MTPRKLPRIRSALFVPGGRAEFLAKADQRGADAVILDLEDAVAEGRRDEARRMVSDWISTRPDPLAPAVCVRINAIDEGHLEADLSAIVHPQLTAVVIPKIEHEHEVLEVGEAVAWFEGLRGVPRGQVRLWPLVETASAVQRADRIAGASPRVAFMGGGTSQQGDLARALHFEWTRHGAETMYVRSKVLVDVRAAGVSNPISGLVSSVGGLEDLEIFARQSKQLGYEGIMLIHPSHVPLANEVFSPSDDERTEARALVAALDDAEARGLGAVNFRGRMVDKAMIETIRSQGLLDD